MDKIILVFGTSISFGAWDSEGGWVERFRRYINNQVIESNYENRNYLYNLSISGNKTTDVLKRFDSETQLRLRGEREIIILFEIGINDTIYKYDLGGFEVPAEKFKDNLILLIGKARKYSKKIIFMGLTPVDKRVDPMPWHEGERYKEEFVTQYNRIIKDVAQAEGVYFIEIYQEFISDNYSSLLGDGLHPNDDGHEKLYEIVKDFLVKEKII